MSKSSPSYSPERLGQSPSSDNYFSEPSLSHSNKMARRWLAMVQANLTEDDIQDVQNAQAYGEDKRRQTAPEYAQLAYESMLRTEKPIGNYLVSEYKRRALKIEMIDRESMVALIQELHRIKKYHIETLFLAVSIADRFLAKLARSKFCAPNLVQLATVSLLMAAKMMEHINPCFDIMISILPDSLRGMVSRAKLIRLESIIVRTLDFNL